MLYIVMGVSGCGKSTVGKLLANELRVPFFDADNFHSEKNILKMKDGIPLTDEDRMPWLTELSELIAKWENKDGAVLACSALKEKYRKILQSKANNKIQWIFLEGSLELILERLKKRKDHFMHENLIASQFMALEKPSYGLHLNISEMPERLVELIVNNKLMIGSDFGIIGLGVMGKSLSLNLTHKKIKVSVYNRNLPGEEEFIARKFGQQYPDILCLDCHDELESFIHFLTRPRKILLMIKAGDPVDEMIDILLPHLEEGDIIIDGGNSFYKDTNRRIKKLAEHKINFIGLGISGGEEGALKGPSLMPGGDKEAYEETRLILELLAAKDKSGNPCCSYVGPEGSGHFTKMIHNGIEYAEMQLLAEVYSILRNLSGLSTVEIADLFLQWQKENLNSYLLEITIDILRKTENNYLLLDKILDKAESKGTGSWSATEALNLGVACNTISESVMARYVSSMKEFRTEASKIYTNPESNKPLTGISLDTIKEGYRTARIINHHIGFSILQEKSKENNWQMDMKEVARIWTSGCIIRSALMEDLSKLLDNDSPMLLNNEIVERMKKSSASLIGTVGFALQNSHPAPALSGALNYFLSFKTENSPANLIQAQRDYFGSHTYKRVDYPDNHFFHTEWKSPDHG